MIFFRPAHFHDPAWAVTPRVRWLIWTSGWRGILTFSTLITLAVLAFNGAAIYQKAKIWRAERLIAQSVVARQKGENEEAASALRQAIVLVQRHPLVLRAVARHQLELHDLAALDTYAMLVRTPDATLDDKVTLGRQAFLLGRPDLASPVVAELASLPPSQQTPAVLTLQAEQAATKGHWSQALSLARQSSTITGTDADRAYSQFILARLLLQQPTPPPPDSQAMRSEGMKLLCTLAMRQDEAALQPLEFLIRLSQNPEASPLFFGRDFIPLLTAAEQHPLASAELKVGIWNLRLAAEPDQRDQICQELFKHSWAQQTDSLIAKDLPFQTARWLGQKGQHQMALQLARPAKLDSKDWFIVFLDSTAAQNGWDEVLRALNSSEGAIPLAPALQKLFKFRAELETDRHPDVAASWREIRVASQKTTAKDQLYIAAYAEKLGLPVEAGRIYHQLLNRTESLAPSDDKLTRPRRLACYTGQLRTSAADLPLKDLAAFMKTFAAEFPEIDEVQNDNAYLQLLMGRELDTAASTAQQLTQKRPEILAYRTTMALASLRQNDILEAAAIYKGREIDWNTAPDRYRTVYAAVMRAAGRTHEANRVAAKIKAENLRPEERQLAGLP